MRILRLASLLSAMTAPFAAPAWADDENPFSFSTSGEFVRDCDGASPPEQCLNAVMHVEMVIDDGTANGTCDGGFDALLEARTNDELNEMLTERVVRIVPWLKAHPEYDSQSYGDGVWAALRGVYCH